MNNSLSYLVESYVESHNKHLLYFDLLDRVDSPQSMRLYQGRADYFREVCVNLSSAIIKKCLEREGYVIGSDGKYVNKYVKY